MKLFGGKSTKSRSKTTKNTHISEQHDNHRNTVPKHRESVQQSAQDDENVEIVRDFPWKKFITVLVVIAVLIVGVSAVLKIVVRPPEHDDPDPIDTSDLDTSPDENPDDVTGDQPEVLKSYKDGCYTMLVVGLDKGSYNTDTILVATFHAENQEITSVDVMSIPRDTASNVSRKVKKINSAYGTASGGNIDQLKLEVSYLLGFEVDNYVIIDLNAFILMVDAIGGVEFNVENRLYYTDPWQDLVIDIQPGLQVLNGQQAMGLVRFRQYAMGDIKRISVQQKFIKAVAKQMMSVNTIPKIPELAQIVFDNVKTDLSLGEITWYAKGCVGLDYENDLHTYTLPNTPEYMNGLSYTFVNEDEALELINEYFNPYEQPITELNLFKKD